MGIRTGKAVWLVTIILVLTSLPFFLTSCDPGPNSSQQGELLTIPLAPDPNLLLTLTAWPTPPPVQTRAPTRTMEPQLLWVAESESQPISTEIPKGETSTPAPPPKIVLAPRGSLPPPTRLQIPALDLDVEVVKVRWDVLWNGSDWVSVWQTADNAVGHHRHSASPGEAGNIVISGHHNTKGEPFREVSEIGQPGAQLQVGDEIVLINQDNQSFTYTIIQWDRIPEEGATANERAQHASYLNDTTDGTLTLVTCWPYESNTHRVVIVAKLTSS